MMESSGEIVEGTVSKILPYGAIVSLSEERTGLVHISEISDEYVTDIAEYLHEGDLVKVLVIAEKEPGRFELSIKKANPPSEGGSKPRVARRSAPSKDFEQRLSEFMKQSNQRQSELRRSREARRGG